MEHVTGEQRVGSAGASTEIPPTVLVDALPIPAFLVRLDGTVIACNVSAGALLGVPDPIVGRNVSTIMVDRVADLVSAIEELKERLHPSDAGVTGLRVDLDWSSLILRPARSATGTVLGILITAPEANGATPHGDVSGGSGPAAAATSGSADADFHATAAQLGIIARTLRDLQGRLEERERGQPLGPRKNEFLAMLAHELRNPLAPILNAIHIVRAKLAGDRAATQALAVADRQVRHQARLLEDLLDTSRVVLGKIELRTERVDLGALLGQAVSEAAFAFRSRAQEVSLSLPEHPLIVTGDPSRLEQIFRNLLSNAGKYTGPGGRISIVAESSAGDVVVTVRDTGIGIEADVLPRVFDLFVQADSSLAHSQGGIGVGLTLVQHLVRLHGGRVSARSQGAGRGSEFEVRLPRSVTAIEPGDSPPGPDVTSHRRRIVVVEDNRDARQMLRMLLEVQGHHVDEAVDGRSGIALAAQRAPDVVIVDIGLPGVDGYEVGRRIRNMLGAAVRLIALTGYGDAESRRKSTAAGFDRHLVKPVPPEELARALGPS